MEDAMTGAGAADYVFVVLLFVLLVFPLVVLFSLFQNLREDPKRMNKFKDEWKTLGGAERFALTGAALLILGLIAFWIIFGVLL